MLQEWPGGQADQDTWVEECWWSWGPEDLGMSTPERLLGSPRWKRN